MNGIKMSDCRFYVDEEARVVVCVIPETEEMVMNFIHDHFRWEDIDFWYALGHLQEKLYMPNSFMGKAVCADEDEWNEETGKLIAFSRAKGKCYSSFFKRANLFVQTIDGRLGDMITAFNDFGMRLEDKREGLQQRINELTGAHEEEEEE
jgi:hypothetical protein